MTGKELEYIRQAHQEGWLAANGSFTKKCQAWLEENIGCPKALLTHSGTAALEMAAVLADIQPGDEIIMPSYTFVSTATSFVLRGGIPVFVDIREDTLNIDEKKIPPAVTPKTKAIVPVHYAGVSCAMDEIMEIAKKHKLIVIEDAAHGIKANYKNRSLGSIGHMAAVSFHETKNVISGEGGALLINDSRFCERAEIIAEKGTNRRKFFRGEVDKYSWVDLGSSYLPSELVAAFLWAQMEAADEITKRRLVIWSRYHEALKDSESKKNLRRPNIPEDCVHNGHMYYILLPDLARRNSFIARLKEKGIHSVFHYVPLHNSSAGKKYGRAQGDLNTTQSLSERLVRLPLWVGIEDELEYIIQETLNEIET